MKLYQSLTIHANDVGVSKFEQYLDANTTGWVRSLELEKRLNKSTTKYVALRSPEDRKPVAATIYLVEGNEGLQLANILPIGRSSLNEEEYNSVVSDFVTQVLVPVQAEFGLSPQLGPQEQQMAEFVSPDTLSKLISFSDLANKSTGSSHPSDLSRWYDFLITCVEEDNLPSLDLLRTWLEENGWEEDKAYDLILQYEFGTGLLKRWHEARYDH